MKRGLRVVPVVLCLCFSPAVRAAETVRMERMNWPDIKKAIESGCTTAVVGVGSIEQHGPHLPTMTDARISDALAELVARKLGGALQARTIETGLSDHHLAFAGTISLKPETLRLILRDYTASLVRHGFKRILFIPMHGGNFETVGRFAAEARKAHPGIDVTAFLDLPGLTDFLSRLSAEYGVSKTEAGDHAGENETSMMMALEGGLVASERFAPGYCGPFGGAEMRLLLEKGMPALSADGVLGDPRKASAEKGRIYLERLADFIVASVGGTSGRR